MMSKVFIFLAMYMAIVLLDSSAEGRRGARSQAYERNNTDTCTTNDECKGRKVCNIENGNCVRCIEDSDCRTGKRGTAKMEMARRSQNRGQRSGQFCFVYKCQDTLPANATCIKDSWCTSGMCQNGECAEGKTAKYGY